MKANQKVLKNPASLIASVLVPIAVVIIGNMYSSAIKESETSVRYVELAVEILKTNPSNDNSNMREWAVDLINNYSEIEINQQTRAELLTVSLLEGIDDFIAEKYAPFIIGHVIKDPKILENFKNTINSGSNEEIKKIFTEFVLASYDQLELKKMELKKAQEN